MQIRLSQLVDDLEIIKLETRDTALVKSGYMAVSDRYMLLGSYLMPCKLFDNLQVVYQLAEPYLHGIFYQPDVQYHYTVSTGLFPGRYQRTIIQRFLI